MDEEEFIIWINDLEERTKKRDKREKRKWLITHIFAGLIPAVFFVILVLSLR